MDTQALSLDMKSLRVGGESAEHVTRPDISGGYHSFTLTPIYHIRDISLYRAISPSGKKVVIKCPTSAEATEATSILQHEWDLFGEDTLAKESAIMRPFRCVELEEWSSLALVDPDDDLRPLAHVYKGRFGVALPNYDHISGYLMKPIQSSRLIQTIKAALNSTEEES